MDKLTQHRKTRLAALVKGAPYHDNQQAFATRVELSKGRISQMLNPDHSFGEKSAQELALKLGLGDRYFEEGFAVGENHQPAAHDGSADKTATVAARPTPSFDAINLGFYLDKITDPDRHSKVANAALQVILKEVDGPPPEAPTPEPAPECKKQPAAHPDH